MSFFQAWGNYWLQWNGCNRIILLEHRRVRDFLRRRGLGIGKGDSYARCRRFIVGKLGSGIVSSGKSRGLAGVLRAAAAGFAKEVVHAFGDQVVFSVIEFPIGVFA